MQQSLVVWGALSILILVILWILIHRKHAAVCHEDYLEVLSFSEWKKGRDIKKELEKMKGGWLGYGEVYIDLQFLVTEGLAVKRLNSDKDGLIAEFKKISGGKRVLEKSPDTPILAPTPSAI